MRLGLFTRNAILLAALAASWPPSLAQAPRQAGTICVTPTFWCRAQHPGPPGTKCACYAAGAWYQGVLN
jgi:hypothetical protein